MNSNFLNSLLKNKSINFSSKSLSDKKLLKIDNSPAPKTLEWDEIIWWVKVVPDLGSPTMNIRLGISLLGF